MRQAIGAVLVTVALGFGLVVLFLAWVLASVPAYRLDLFGTAWSVAAIDGVPLIEPLPVIAFSSDANHASVSLACGKVPLNWVWDSDGAGLSLWYEQRPDACMSTTAQDNAILRAILDLEEWSYQSDSMITLIGTNELRLARAR
jgi:hypothetical protein